MNDDPLRKELLVELRALRRSPDPLNLEHLAASPRLVEVVGNGSVEQVHGTLLDVLDQQRYLNASDVVTYFATCGVDTSGTTLDARLTELARARFVDPRTVLRHSNAGAEKLSGILRDMSLLSRPLGKINVVQRGNVVACQILLRLPKHSRYRQPAVYLNGSGEKTERLSWELKDDPNDSDWLTAVETLHGLPLHVTNKTNRYIPVWSVAVYWLMPVWASWTTAMELSDNRLSTVLGVTRNYRAEVALYFDSSRQ